MSLNLAGGTTDLPNLLTEPHTGHAHQCNRHESDAECMHDVDNLSQTLLWSMWGFRISTKICSRGVSWIEGVSRSQVRFVCFWPSEAGGVSFTSHARCLSEITQSVALAPAVPLRFA